MNKVYHGTRYLSSILSDDCLKCAPSGDCHVSLTWDRSEARYWAKMPRDDGNKKHGHVIVLNRDSLEQAGYVLEPFVSMACDRDEKELACLKDISPIRPHIVAVWVVKNMRAA